MDNETPVHKARDEEKETTSIDHFLHIDKVKKIAYVKWGYMNFWPWILRHRTNHQLTDRQIEILERVNYHHTTPTSEQASVGGTLEVYYCIFKSDDEKCVVELGIHNFNSDGEYLLSMGIYDEEHPYEMCRFSLECEKIVRFLFLDGLI